MKEFIIHHIPAGGESNARVQVSYCPQEGAQAQQRETAFEFAVTEDQRRLIQWYLEEYLMYPWGEFRLRAEQAEKLMEQLGVQLFDAVFSSRDTATLYGHVADDLAHTRIVIHASDPEGIALPWEFMRDSTHGEYGDLARLAHAFVRSQPDLSFQPPPAPAANSTFNILMVICRPGGSDGDVPFQSVARPMLELFRPHRDRVRLDILRPPTFEQLSRVLNDKPNFYVQSAVRFMARLYQSLINGEELARAVAHARDDLRSHPQRLSPIGDVPLRDWVVPLLFEFAPVHATSTPLGNLRLSPSLLKDEQSAPGVEINLPEPPAFGFVGRDGVMLDLERAFQTETIVLLEGMAGVGKTEMSAGFARWRAETGALDGPIFFFRFEHYLPLSHVYDRVGQVFASVIQQQLKVEWHLLDPDQRRQIALSVLKQVPCMLIWDNFEPVAGFPAGTPSSWKPDEQQELRDFLRDLHGGQTKVLLTSRRDEKWLGNFYRRVQLGGLKLIEAQELAVRVLKRAGLNPQQIKALPQYNDLLKYLRGNPLAIQAILPELQRTKPDVLLQALRTGEIKLSGDDPTQGRERSLSASLTYRLDTLDPTLRHRLGVLALFQGFVDADVLSMMSEQVNDEPELIKGLGRDEWIRILDTATEVGLLRKIGEGYYTVHPALPWFFHDLLLEAFPNQVEWLEKAFSAAYGAYGGYLTESFQSNAQVVMSLLSAEENSLTYALRLARQHEKWDDVRGILYGFNRLLVTQGRWVEWDRLINEIEKESVAMNGDPLAGREDLWRALLGHRAEIANFRRDYDAGEAIYVRLKDYYERAGDERNQSAMLHQLGVIAHERRQFVEAERWYRQSLAIEERIGDEHGQASTLHQLGMIAEEQGNALEAVRIYEQAEALYANQNDPYRLDIVRKSLKRVRDGEMEEG